jgi:nucleotidyltransferase/DNA polymerase involved in DNA repair
MGIHTIGELAKCDPAWLRTILKKQGEVVWSFANGIDFSPVITEPPANKGYGNSTTTPFDVVDADTAKTMNDLRDFMFEEVYQNPVAKGEEGKSEAIVAYLYDHFVQDAGRLPAEYWAIADRDGLPAAVCDYIAGMTDRYAVMVYQELTIPKSWNKY